MLGVPQRQDAPNRQEANAHQVPFGARFRITLLRPFLLVFFAAAIVRMGWVTYVFVTRAPAFSSTQPLWAAEMGNIAINITEGRGFSSPFSHGTQPTAWECPIVPFVYAGFIKLAGGPTGRAIRLIFLSQALVSAFAAAMYWLIVRKSIIRYPGVFSAWLSPVLAVVVSVWPESMNSVTNPWYWVWQEAALAVFVLLAMRWWDRSDFGTSMLVGMTGGVLALINVTPLPIVAVGILFPALKSRCRRSILGPTVISVAAFALVVTPWLIRNGVVFHTFVSLRSNAGFELFHGNSELECIRETEIARHPATNRQEFERYAALGEIKYCSENRARAIEYIRQHPWDTVRRTALRIYVSWFTDLTDHWTWDGESKWWSKSRLFIARYLASVLLTVASVGIILSAALSGRLRSLPYAPLFAAVVVLLPIPHYFTFADQEYTAVLRMWLGVIAVQLLALRRPRADGGFVLKATHPLRG